MFQYKSRSGFSPLLLHALRHIIKAEQRVSIFFIGLLEGNSTDNVAAAVGEVEHTGLGVTAELSCLVFGADFCFCTGSVSQTIRERLAGDGFEDTFCVVAVNTGDKDADEGMTHIDKINVCSDNTLEIIFRYQLMYEKLKELDRLSEQRITAVRHKEA